MVPGLNVFRDWFENYHGRHVIIGGTACNLVYAQYGAPERATKDIDLIVLAEAFDRAYFDRFVMFVHAGGYEHRTKDGRYLPVFKMHAWANLTRDRANGHAVHSDEINKHRSDVCKLCSLFDPGTTVELPETVRKEVAGFVDAHPWNDNMLRGWRLPVDSEGMANVIRSVYL